MRILGLPGKDARTEQWLHDVLDAIEIEQARVSVQSYECWKSPGSELDLEGELARAHALSPDLIVAKSIGVRVSLHGYTRDALRAEAYVMIGTPLNSMPDEELAALSGLCDEVPTLLIQNRDDPVGGY